MGDIVTSSKYNAEDGATICAGLSEGHSLLSICEAMGVNYETAKGWERDIQKHANDSARAREIGCHALADGCLSIADDGRNDWMEQHGQDSPGWRLNGEHLQRSRLRIDTRMRLLGKWLPKVYGDKVAIGGASDLPPIKTDNSVTLTPEDAYKRMLNGK